MNLKPKILAIGIFTTSLLVTTALADDIKPEPKFDIFKALNNSEWTMEPAGNGKISLFQPTCAKPIRLFISESNSRYRVAPDGFPELNADILEQVTDNKGNPTIVIRYDNDWNLPSYDPRETYQLVMPDRDHFYWKKFDAESGKHTGKSEMRLRCNSDNS